MKITLSKPFGDASSTVEFEISAIKVSKALWYLAAAYATYKTGDLVSAMLAPEGCSCLSLIFSQLNF